MNRMCDPKIKLVKIEIYIQIISFLFVVKIDTSSCDILIPIGGDLCCRLLDQSELFPCSTNSSGKPQARMIQ